MSSTDLSAAFATAITPDGRAPGALAGPWRKPVNLLKAQTYDAHASIHDDATAQKLGFRGGTIEGPTHFSQLTPLLVALWGRAFLETGCISANYRNAAYEGEEVQALVSPIDATQAQVAVFKRDGTPVLSGSASVGATAAPSRARASATARPRGGCAWTSRSTWATCIRSRWKRSSRTSPSRRPGTCPAPARRGRGRRSPSR
jgi:hypothetical protein